MKRRSVSTGIDHLFDLFPGYCSEIPVDPVEYGTANPRHVALDRIGAARALM